jgi:Ca2+-binding RTX toxin-like protein
MTRWTAGLGSVMAALAIATPAHAATLSRSGTTLIFAAAAGEQNTPQVTTSNGNIVINDGNDVVTGPGCTTDATSAATECSLEGVTKVIFRLGDLDDELRLGDNELRTKATFQVDGGAGKDHLRGTELNDVLLGGPGADSINGTAGKDTIKGGSGNDDITGFGTIYGGPGNDFLSMFNGFADVKHFPSRVFGGAGNDEILVGNKVRDVVDCGSGKDRATTSDKRGFDRFSRNCEGSH